MNEIWKDIVGYEGIYEISNYGSIRTKEGKITRTDRHGDRHWKQRTIKLKQDRNGYKRTSLWIDGKHQDWLVHRLVAITFIPNPNNYPMINHIDGVTSNNYVDNLEWCTPKHNVNHAIDNGLMPYKKIRLIDKETKQEYEFRSMAKASEFLNKDKRFISSKLSQNKTEVFGYLIKVVD